MNPWTTQTAQTEPHLCAWTAELNRLETEMKAAANEAKTGLLAHLAQHDAARKTLNQDIADQIQQWDTELDQLDDELVAVAGEVEAELLAATDEATVAAEERLATLRANSEAGRQQLQASLAARLGELEAGIEALETQVATVEPKARAKLSARLAPLRPKCDEAQRALQYLAEANRANWRAMLARANRALDDLAANIENLPASYGA